MMVLLISRAWRERDLPAFLLEFLHTQVGNRHRANGHDFHERTKQQAARMMSVLPNHIML